MSTRNFESLFRPRSVAVIGASARVGRIGNVVLKNLLAGGFEGPILPVNPKYGAIAGVLAYPDVASLPLVPDLAVIATPPRTVPGLIAELGERGTRAAVVLTAGLSRERDADGRSLTEAMLLAAEKRSVRILGPNSVGLLAPYAGLDASFSHMGAEPGTIAFVSQSGALCTAVLDWARARGIGFSHFISLGDSADVDFGDVLDWLSRDPNVRSILLYIESVRNPRKFLSAARGASRAKTVIALKAGRAPEGAKAAMTHTGALAGADEVWDAALRRAGVLRVSAISELFEGVETLARARTPRGDKLLVFTNGGGPGVIAIDALVRGGGSLADLSPSLLERLDRELPATWSRSNPIDIIGDADSTRFGKALGVVLDETKEDSVLVLHVPTAVLSAASAAQTTAAEAQGREGNVLSCFMGGAQAESARRIAAGAGLPVYDTPESAVRAFLHTIHYRRSRRELLETPPSLPGDLRFDTERAQEVIQRALDEGRHYLGDVESREVLRAYGFPVVESRVARDASEAERVAREIEPPYVVKIVSPDVVHKSDVGGVVLNVQTAEGVKRAVEDIRRRVLSVVPDARVHGFDVQRFVRRKHAHELLLGVFTDPVFGPVILFGHGGVAAEVVRDRAVALPPLNLALARDLIRGTRIARLLDGYRDRPPAAVDDVCLDLVRLSQLIADVPEIESLDINPLLCDADGTLALDSRMVLARPREGGTARFAIRPYPTELEECAVLANGRRVLLRPIRPEDEPQHLELFSRLGIDDIRFRFFGLVRDLSHEELARYTQIDYDREMAFIATAPDERGVPETLGVARASFTGRENRAEFAIIVRPDVKRARLGTLLLEKLARYARSRGAEELYAEVLEGNHAMLCFVRRLGFETHQEPGGGWIVRKKL